MKIGELAKLSGTKVVTIRYYEKIGLLSEPSRTVGNYRNYTQSHRQRLEFIRRCRNLGFPLNQVRELLTLSEQQHQSCEEVNQLAADHLATIHERLVDLQNLEAELLRITAACEGGEIENCRIIEALLPEQNSPSG